ncbi:MAG TPA: family 1 encapsulin nanocompartment shell protein [Fodinibius sp.]|nr:family 1 encapsulin nanocompartment shell protein [Fodinibius sp.]
MDILKTSLAPITEAAWAEIYEEATDIFSSVLSARKFVDVDGPKGLDYSGVHTGRIDIESNKNDSVQYGLNRLLPLVETRAGFSLDIWELDNASRGAEDVNLENLEKAAREIASFEEKAIYYGLEKAGIEGISQQAEHKSVELPESTNELMNTLSKELTVFKCGGIEGPYSLVLNENDWERISSQIDDYPLRRQIKDMLEGSIILSPFINGGFLVSERGGDFRLTLGQDLSIGYHFHDKETVELYFTESFTFQCFEPQAVCVFSKPGN